MRRARDEADETPLAVRAAGGNEAPLAFSYVNRLCMGLLYGRAGRLNTKNADLRPGQWHTDQSFSVVPPKATCFFCQSVRAGAPR